MKIVLSVKDIQSAIQKHGGIENLKSSDKIAVGVGRSVSDCIVENAVFNLHKFDSDIYDGLARERRQVAEMLLEGHKHRDLKNPDKADEFFQRGFDLQEKLVNSHAHESSLINGNALLDEGINAMTNLVCGGAETAYNNANAQLGVGTSAAPSLTGTCTFTQNSKSISGASTLFNTELVVGDWIKATTSTVWYRIASIASDTSLDLERLFEETTESGVTGYNLDVSLTDLQGTVVWQGMDTGYPTFGSGQNMVFQSVYDGSTANQAWNNFGVRNGASADKNMNLKYSAEGTKSAGQTWTLNLQIDLL